MTGSTPVQGHGREDGDSSDRDARVHHGSASVQLSGRGVLATWVFSLGFHALVFILMFSIPWISGLVTGEVDLPIPNAELLGDLTSTSFAASKVPDLSAKPSAEPEALRIAPKDFDQLAELKPQAKPELSLLGIGAGGGDFEGFGLSAGADSGVEFFGLGKSAPGARRVVYVVDRSGSISGVLFKMIKAELKRSITSLRPSQKFHVIFFNNRALQNPPRRLVNAIAVQKEEFFEFLDSNATKPMYGTLPARSLSLALDLEPDIIYLLTDGEFDEPVLPMLAKRNPDCRTRIFTIAFFYEGGKAILRQIARQHCGEYKEVNERSPR